MVATCARMRVITIAAGLLTAAGCGGSQEFPLVPVSGTVTFAGGPCPKPGSIVFGPKAVDEGLPQRAGSASFQEDGHFEVTSFKAGDGLVPGTYVVKVTCWEKPPTDDDPT